MGNRSMRLNDGGIGGDLTPSWGGTEKISRTYIFQ